MHIKGKIMFKKIVLISALSVAFSSLACAESDSAKPTPTTPAPQAVKKPHDNNMAASAVCKSGSRVVSYDYDAKTGLLSASTTFDKCVLPNGTSITGSTSIDGTLLATGKTAYSIDLTDQVDTTFTGKSGLTYTRKCTIVKKGTLDTKTHVFSGSIQRDNCGLSGDFRENRDFIEHLLKHDTNSEEDDTDNSTPTSTNDTDDDKTPTSTTGATTPTSTTGSR